MQMLDYYSTMVKMLQPRKNKSELPPLKEGKIEFKHPSDDTQTQM